MTSLTTRNLMLGATLLAGCCGPWQGAGALYIWGRGAAVCVNVRSVTFYASHLTRYTDFDGRSLTTAAPVSYYAGERCEIVP